MTTYHHKKILHFYNQADQEFAEIHEGVFSSSGKTKQAVDLDDWTFQKWRQIWIIKKRTKMKVARNSIFNLLNTVYK